MDSEAAGSRPGPSARSMRLVKEAVGKLELDLSGLVVLTEAASGNYIYTPLICACAGSRQVLAFTRDSGYATGDAVSHDTLRAARRLGVADRITVLKEISDGDWGSADIVTNLGFLRPLDRSVVSKLKETAAVPLMFETWEFRESDLDLRACWERGITVLGTNEEHGAIKILDYLGGLVAKKLFEQGVEIMGSRIVVLGRGKFFTKVSGALEKMGAFVLRWFADVENAEAGAGFEQRLEALHGADAFVIADEPVAIRVLIGAGGFLSGQDLARHCPDAIVVQLAGVIDRTDLKAATITCLPDEAPVQGHMGWSLSELGPKTVIDLHAAGLKVGELLARGRLDGLGPKAAVARALGNPLCQDFSPEQKRSYGCPF